MRVPLVVVALMSACVGTTTVSTGGYVSDEPSSYTYTGGSGEVSADVSLSLFQSELAPYGQWVSASSYGSCWQPSQSIVGSEFEPYGTGGSWAWTDAGWQFESDLPFGWATFHYGRWLQDPAVGWCWAPGTEWAPSWVSWRYGEGFVGWAPLPPDNWAYRSRYQPQWVFVDAPHFVARDAWRYRLPDYHRAYSVTRPVAPSAGARVVGPPPQQITQYIGRPVPTAPVARGRPPPGQNRPWIQQRQEVQPPAGQPVRPAEPPAAQQPPPHRFNPTTPPERHRGWQQEQQQVQPQPPAAQPQPPPAQPQPPAAQPPPPAGRMPPAPPRPAPPQWGHQRDEDRGPPRAMPQPPVATPPQGMPPAPPQARPPEAHGPPAGAPPPVEVRPLPPGQEKRRGPPEKKDPDERKEERRRQER